MIDWTNCPDVTRSADILHGAWRVTGRHVPVQALLDNTAAGRSAEEVADMFALAAKEKALDLHKRCGPGNRLGLTAALAEAAGAMARLAETLASDPMQFPGDKRSSGLEPASIPLRSADV